MSAAPFVAVTAVALTLLMGAEHKGLRPLAWAAKIIASSAFVALALQNGVSRAPHGTFALLAFSACWVGDLLLIPKNEKVFLAGILAFLSGHVFFLLTFFIVGIELRTSALVFVGLLIPLVLVGRVLLPKVRGALLLAVLIYMVMVSAMLAAAAGAVSTRGWPIFLAALAFYLSDLTVARNRFLAPALINRAVGLPLYYGAQLLFAEVLAG